MTLVEVFDGLVRMASSLTQKFVLERVCIYRQVKNQHN